MAERRLARQVERRHAVAHGAALLRDDGVAAVAPHRRRGEPEEEARAEAVRHALERRRREAVAFVDDHESVSHRAQLGVGPAQEALQDRHVDPARRAAARAAADAADVALAQAEELREPGDPLALERDAVHDDERAPPARRDHPRREDRLAERRPRLQHAAVVPHHRLRRGLLLRPQFAAERNVQSLALLAVVPHAELRTEPPQRRPRGVHASARQGEARFFAQTVRRDHCEFLLDFRFGMWLTDLRRRRSGGSHSPTCHLFCGSGEWHQPGRFFFSLTSQLAPSLRRCFECHGKYVRASISAVVKPDDDLEVRPSVRLAEKADADRDPRTISEQLRVDDAGVSTDGWFDSVEVLAFVRIVRSAVPRFSRDGETSPVCRAVDGVFRPRLRVRDAARAAARIRTEVEVSVVGKRHDPAERIPEERQRVPLDGVALRLVRRNDRPVRDLRREDRPDDARHRLREYVAHPLGDLALDRRLAVDRHRLDASMGLDARDAADGTARALGVLEHRREERGRLLQRRRRAGRQLRERNAEAVRKGPADAGTTSDE